MAERFDLRAFAYAHRGLWQKDGAPENSLAAFLAAAEAGLGAELDLRPTADGNVMVFHDPLLDRMTSASGVFEQMTTPELAQLRLGETQEHILPFAELLSHWPKNLPLLCEVKVDGTTHPEEFAWEVGAFVAHWSGPAAMMSFSEGAVRVLPKHFMRGQLILPCSQTGDARFERVAERAMSDGLDYLAVHHTDAEKVAMMTDGRGMPVVVWTVRSEADLAAVRPYNPAIIFEHIDPALAAP